MNKEEKLNGGIIGPEFKNEPPLRGSLIRTLGFVFIIFIIALIAVTIIPQRGSEFQGLSSEKGQESARIELPKILYNLVGLVQDLDEDSFILQASIPQVNESGQLYQKTEERRVNITASTKITKLTFVSQEGQSGKTPVETPMTFDDIKVGDYIEVIASQDISQVAEFEADQARFLPKNF